MILRLRFVPALALLALGWTATPAYADRCDDLARQLKGQIDGLAVGRTAANVIYLSHPVAKQIRLGCASRSVTNEVYAVADARKPAPAFAALVAGAAAIVFTIPRADMLKGTNRCLGQMGLLRGDDIRLRYKRLDLRCTRNKTAATISISRERED